MSEDSSTHLQMEEKFRMQRQIKNMQASLTAGDALQQSIRDETRAALDLLQEGKIQEGIDALEDLLE